jgi:hypothetical protein
MENRTTSALALMLGALGGILAACPGDAQQGSPSRPPVIQHDPITFAVPRQPLSIMARIAPGSAPIRSATLYYTPSRDTAPIAQPMTPSGGNLYVATIPPAHLQSVDQIFYYIETVDQREEWAETPYQLITVRPSDEAAETTAPPAAPAESGSKRIYWLAGGAAAIGIGAAALAGSGGGGGGQDAANPSECLPEDVPGAWINSDTTVAPGFQTFADNRAQFFYPLGAAPEEGFWRLAGCDLSLFPFGTNTTYSGTGTLSADKTTVTINGNTFTRQN